MGMFYPLMVAFCVIIVVFYTIYKGTPQLGLKETPLGVACGVAFSCGAVAALITWGLVTPRLKERMENPQAYHDFGASEKKDQDIEMGDGVVAHVAVSQEKDKLEDTTSVSAASFKKVTNVMESVVPDIEKRFQDAASQQVLDMLANAEQNDPKAELAFSYLQVFSACFDAFAHGANDVANSIGPMAAVYGIWNEGVVEKKVEMPLWILAMGGIGIVAGLMLYGYNIIQAIGLELTKLSPSRGFSIELGAALVVLTGSRLEIPLSTTHCQVGATVGVGLTEGCGNINWFLFGKVIAGWIITLLVAALMTAAVFSYAVYAPHEA